jgi:hypothetical protein
LEKSRAKYAIRIPANDSLEQDIVELLTRPVGRPSRLDSPDWYRSYRPVARMRARILELHLRHYPTCCLPTGLLGKENLVLDHRLVRSGKPSKLKSAMFQSAQRRLSRDRLPVTDGQGLNLPVAFEDHNAFDAPGCVEAFFNPDPVQAGHGIRLNLRAREGRSSEE